MRENSMYNNWVYRPANFNEDIERWAWNCKDGLKDNLDQPSSEDWETAQAWAEQEISILPWEGDSEQPEDWNDFLVACHEALRGEIISTLKSMRYKANA